MINRDTLEIKLIDFGAMSRITDDLLTEFFGTLKYAAPEVHLLEPGIDDDEVSDIEFSDAGGDTESEDSSDDSDVDEDFEDENEGQEEAAHENEQDFVMKTHKDDQHKAINTNELDSGYASRGFRQSSQEVWTLGILLFAMFFGIDAFQTRKDSLNLDIKQRIRDLRLRKEYSNINDEAADLITSILSKHPSYRPSLNDIMTHPFCQAFGSSYETNITEEIHKPIPLADEIKVESELILPAAATTLKTEPLTATVSKIPTTGEIEARENDQLQIQDEIEFEAADEFSPAIEPTSSNFEPVIQLQSTADADTADFHPVLIGQAQLQDSQLTVIMVLLINQPPETTKANRRFFIWQKGKPTPEHANTKPKSWFSWKTLFQKWAQL